MKKNNILHLKKLWWLVPGLLFVVYHQKEPLYTKNQNTKFLHGAGNAGYGFLENDWMANTLDPLPLFSTLIESLYLFNAIEITYLFFAAALFIYFHALVRIAQKLFPELKTSAPMVLYLALFFLIHRTNQPGLADQYLLGKYFQPCVLGVFLLLSIERFLNGHRKTASVLLAVSAAFHPAYLPTALIVQATYTTLLLTRENKSARETITPLILFVLLSAPLVIRHLAVFAPTTPDLNHLAMDILANQRIPHHTNIRMLLEPESFLQMGFVLASMLLIRKTPLLPIMGTLYLVITFSGLYLYFFPNAAFAFTTPWRSSVFLVPLAISIFAGWAGQISASFLDRHKKMSPILVTVSCMLVALLTVKQIQKQVNAFEKYRNGKEMAVMNYASAHASSGDLYLVSPDDRNFDKFRLETGIPILANIKTHPYKDTEVIEWDNRCRKAQAFYSSAQPEERIRAFRALIATYPVTHCIISSTTDPAAGFPGRPIYRDAYYTILEIP